MLHIRDCICISDVSVSLTYDFLKQDMQVLDELRHLENFFVELNRGGTLMAELYEKVQICGNVLPRLYVKKMKIVAYWCVFVYNKMIILI